MERQRRAGYWMTATLTCLVLIGSALLSPAQIDPVKRRVLQAGYSMPMREDGPLAAYGFYYMNLPDFPRTNMVLRSALVPVYVDSELGIRQALTPSTDLGIGLAGGGFADSYHELRQGNYYRPESFTGHTAEGSLAVYHLFNPNYLVPLYGVIRGGVHGSFYQRDDDTDPTFQLPENRATFFIRSGVRLGGREPYLTPKLAAEFSVWNETYFRLENGPYGYDGDRTVENYTSRIWGRALFAYTFEESKQFLEVSVLAGTLFNPDRFSSYRLGSSLSLVSEFALTLPGYHIQEISAQDFVQFSVRYLLPLDYKKCWALHLYGSAAVVDYLEGLEQPGDFHSGVGAGLMYASPSRAWQLGVAYAYGIEAIRNTGRGAHTITFQLQYDFDADLRSDGMPFWDPLLSAKSWRGVLNIFSGK